ncbi:putative pectinesterase/pectinesterase inhibitor 41 [Drosera capensis]
MAFICHFSTIFSSTIFLLLFIYPSHGAIVSISIDSSPESICPYTPHPNFCTSILPRIRRGATSTIHDYGRFCINRSLQTTNDFISLVNQQISYGSSRYSVSTLRALEDCQFLASRNLDFLSTTMFSIRYTNSTLPASEAALLQSVLSAIITNFDTCSDGLQAAGSSSGVTSDLGPHISNGTMLSSVSLALVTRGWGTYFQRSRRLSKKESIFSHRKFKMSALPNARHNYYHEHENWPFNLRPSGSRKGRRLLQLDGLEVEVNNITTVASDGSGNYSTISDAVADAPEQTEAGNGYFVIYVMAGVYEEYVSIPKSKTYLLMVGDGINATIVTGNRSVIDGWTTFNSATFAVVADGFIAVNMTFQNTAGAIKQQAVAVRSGADLSAFYSCSFEAYQDTLYAHSLRQFYKQCDIYGTIDFIFGNAAVVFQDCNIFPRQPLQGQFNTITAQGRTDPNQNTGTSIQGATITAAPDLASSNFTVETYLGRPWKNYSTTVFMESYMDAVINPAGWHEWSGTFALDTLYYAEYDNSGPGSNTTDRVTWPGYHIIDANTAENFTVSNFISGDDWLPATGLPYTDGL